jgi:hypothetical protein
MNPLEIAEFKHLWQRNLAMRIVKICEEAAPDGVWDKKWEMPYFVLEGKNILGFWPAKNWLSVFVMDVAKLNAPIPMHLRNAPTKLMKELGYADQASRKDGNLPKGVEL